MDRTSTRAAEQNGGGCRLGAKRAGSGALWARPRGNRAILKSLPTFGLVIALAVLLGGCEKTKERVVNTGSVYVVDGDTIKIGEESIRLMGFDTPETYRAKCNAEKAWGDRATRRVRALLASVQTITLQVNPRKDKYGRSLAILFVGGRDIGPILIEEGLAREYHGGRRQGWCR